MQITGPFNKLNNLNDSDVEKKMRTLVFHHRLGLYFFKKKQGGRGRNKSVKPSRIPDDGSMAPRNYNKRT